MHIVIDGPMFSLRIISYSTLGFVFMEFVLRRVNKIFMSHLRFSNMFCVSLPHSVITSTIKNIIYYIN